MEHIFEAFQQSFLPDEKVIFIANVKDEKNIDGDLMLTNNRLVFYPAKPKNIQDVLFVNIDLIQIIQQTEKGIIISSQDKSNTYEIEILKQDLIEKIQKINLNIKVI